MVPVLEKFVLPHATAMAFFVAYGELAIGLALVLGILVRPASICGAVYMLTLLFSSNYPGSHAPLWQYFGASLDHSVLALCFAAFVFGDADRVLSIRLFAVHPGNGGSAARHFTEERFRKKDIADPRFQGGDHE